MVFLDLIYPFLSVWSIAGYIHIVHILHVFDKISSRWVVLMLFLPVLLLEFYFSLNFPVHASIHPKDIGGVWLFFYMCRSAYWLAFYLVWVMFVARAAKEAVVIKFFITEFYYPTLLLFKAMTWLTLAAFCVWLGLYYVIAVKFGMLRIFVSMVLPILFTLGLVFHLYRYGGIGGLRSWKVCRQKGVEVSFRFKKMGHFKIPPHPRGIFYDSTRNALFVVMGATYGYSDGYPTVIRRDLTSGETQAFVSRNVRRIGFDQKTRLLYVAPWYQDYYYRISMDDMKSVIKQHNQISGILQTWEPMDVMIDVSKPRIYIGNDGEQALVSYHSETGKLEKVLHLLKEKHLGLGGPVWHLRQSEKTHRIYFITGPGHHLFEVDPDSLTVLRKKKFHDVIGTALEIDDDNQLLYYQKGGFNHIYEIDIASFDVRRTFRGETHARRLCLDRKRNALYVLGYLSGTLFSIDLQTGRRQWRICVGGLPHGMALHGDTLWINSILGVLNVNLDRIWRTAAQ